MNYQNALPIAIVYSLLLLLINVNGLPFLFGTQIDRRHAIEYQMPDDNWNITSIPRSIIPHLLARNDTSTSHLVPPRKSNDQIEDELLKRLRDIKVCF